MEVFRTKPHLQRGMVPLSRWVLEPNQKKHTSSYSMLKILRGFQPSNQKYSQFENHQTTWLVDWTLWKILVMGWLFPIYAKIKNVPNHQPATRCIVHIHRYSCYLLVNSLLNMWFCTTQQSGLVIYQSGSIRRTRDIPPTKWYLQLSQLKSLVQF